MDIGKYFTECRHFTQVDPAKNISLDEILNSRTDAVIIAGTQDITESRAVPAARLVADKTDKPVYFAPSHPSQVGAEIRALLHDNIINGLLIYNPLNSKDKDLTNMPKLWYDKVDSEIAEHAMDMGYVVTNPNSTVGKLFKPELRADKIIQSAKDCEFGILYVDGSGKKVDEKLIKDIRKAYPGFLLVGGGIETYNDAKDAFDAGANAINVGTVLERNNIYGYLATIKAAKKTK